MTIFEVSFQNFQQIVSRESNELSRNPIYYRVHHGQYELYFNDSHWKFKTHIPLGDIENWYENVDNFRNSFLQYAVEIIDYD